jgi:TonB family protein
MKKNTFSSILIAIAFSAFAQDSEPAGFAQVSLRKVTLTNIKQVTEVLSSLYPMAGAYNDHWAAKTEILSTTIEGTCNKQEATAKDNDGTFNAVQKQIIESSDVGSIVHLKIWYKERDLFTNEFGEVKHMHLAISIMPDIDALYPGGMTKVVEFLRGNVLHDLSSADSALVSQKLLTAVVKFTVDENGKVIEASMDRSSSDESIDKMLLEATSKMPRWTPAMNVKGEKLKREFTVSVDERKMQGC